MVGVKIIVTLRAAFSFRKVTYHHQSLLIKMSNSSTSDHDSEEELKYMLIYLLMKAAQAIVEYAAPLYDKMPYHTSALSGEA